MHSSHMAGPQQRREVHWGQGESPPPRRTHLKLAENIRQGGGFAGHSWRQQMTYHRSHPALSSVFALHSGGHVTEKEIRVRQNQLGSKSPIVDCTLKDSKAFVARASGCLILFT